LKWLLSVGAQHAAPLQKKWNDLPDEVLKRSQSISASKHHAQESRSDHFQGKCRIAASLCTNLTALQRKSVPGESTRCIASGAVAGYYKYVTTFKNPEVCFSLGRRALDRHLFRSWVDSGTLYTVYKSSYDKDMCAERVSGKVTCKFPDTPLPRKGWGQ
jgi:hypothetical protein